MKLPTVGDTLRHTNLLWWVGEMKTVYKYLEINLCESVEITDLGSWRNSLNTIYIETRDKFLFKEYSSTII